MKLKEFAEIIGCEIIALEGNDEIIDVKNVYIGDLLSIVMSKAQEKCIWITIQTHLNVVAVADLLSMSCIIVVENMDIEQGTIDKANELNVPILKTSKSAFELACIINKI